MQLVQLGTEILSFGVYIAILGATAVIVLAGWKILTAGGDEGAVKTGKKMLWASIVGIIVTWGLATFGVGPDGVTTENLAKVRPVLAAWLPLVKVYDSDSPKTALLGGDVDLGIVWSGEAAILIKEQPGKFVYVLPKEGAHMFIDNVAIPKNAENPAAAHKFIDYILRPDVSAEISKEFPYTNPNMAARKLLTAAELANEASYPPGNPKLSTFRDIGTMASDVDKMFTDLKAKSGG